MAFQHVEIEIEDQVGWLWLNRPDKRNAMSHDMWEDIPTAMSELDGNSDVRVIVVAGRGTSFSVGIDLAMLMETNQPGEGSEASRNMAFYRTVKQLQGTMSAFANCTKPVIAAVHGWCLGAGIDLITAVDIRLASSDAVFGVRETKMGLVADVGTVQRLPRVIAPGHVAELLYTGKDIDADRAERIGLVNDVFPDVDSLHKAAADLASEIAGNSPLIVQSIKAVLRSEEGMTTAAALDHIALWNTAFIRSDDILEAMSAFMEKRPPNYTGT